MEIGILGGRGNSRVALGSAGLAILLLAYWLRDPLLPYDGAATGASGFSGAAAVQDDAEARRSEALNSLNARLIDAARTLDSMNVRALLAPNSASRAFEHLRELPTSPEFGVVLYDANRPIAWAGQLKIDPDAVHDGLSAQFTPFHTAVSRARTHGTRRVVSTVLVHAEPPAERLAKTLTTDTESAQTIESFSFAPAADSAEGQIVEVDGNALLRISAVPLPADMVRFGQRARLRTQGITLLAVALTLFLILAWGDRRRLGRKAFALAVSVIAISIIPWNNFSNVSRIFDPAYFYWARGAPLTANAGVFLLFTMLIVLGVFAVIRARKTRVPRTVATIAAIAIPPAGIAAAVAASSGIALPPWGSTIGLWLAWEVPVFLLIFASALASTWFARIALGRASTVHLREATVVALLAGVLATGIVWRVSTQQRLELATRDLAGLQRADGDASVLLRRFAEELSAYDAPGGRPELLKRYASSDIAAAELQISLASWDANGAARSKLELAPLLYDSAAVTGAVAEASATSQAVIRQLLGPAGRQLILAYPHGESGVTSAVVSPRTRLVREDPFISLLGLSRPVQGEPPYDLTLADLPLSTGARPSGIRWRRIGNEWHGDQILETSRGLSRAHAEVDLRSPATRIVRGSLVVIFNIALVGLLWAMGAMSEGGFLRWARARGWAWIRSYRGRLTLALFTFFVVPALAFAAWSYQRLRGDDRDVRELLVRETLHAAAGENPTAPAQHHAPGETPLFVYSNAFLRSSSDSLYEMIAPNGRALPSSVHLTINQNGELTGSSQQHIADSRVLWGYRAAGAANQERYVLAAPSRSDELTLDRRRRDLTLLVLFATAAGGLAALWLSGIAGRILARDLELSRVEVARAERVLAWGEMARQVAHEIKNPLTPIRLGVQHLRRARNDPRVDFDKVLNENVTRILSEIDRLDEIARAFTRYGAAPADLPPAERIDVAAILRDVVALERMGVGDVSWDLRGTEESVYAYARNDELRDVLLNVFENARLARARKVSVSLAEESTGIVIDVSDDGTGISPEALPRVFEPHFSTRTTGSGLGLAISRRLLESWKGTIELASVEGNGARVTITLRPAPE